MAALGVSALVLSGCTAGDDGAESAPESSAGAVEARTPADLIWKSYDYLVGDVIVAGGAALGYVLDDEKTYLLARDLETGEELWKTRAYRATISSYLPLDPVALEHDGHWYAAAYNANAEGATFPALIDLETGKFVEADGPQTEGLSGDGIVTCGDTFCLTGDLWVPNDSEDRVWTYNWETGGWDAGLTAARFMEDGRRIVSDFVFTTSLSSDERGTAADKFGYIVDGDVEWQQAYRDVFGAGYSGGVWDDGGLDDPAGVVVGYASTSESEDEDQDENSYVVDYANDTKMVAVDAADGTKLWERQGARSSCNLGAGGAVEETNLFVFCESLSGAVQVTFEEEEEEGRFTESRKITEPFEERLVAVDRETGEEAWSLDLPERTEEDIERLSSPLEVLQGEQQWVIEQDEGLMGLDPATGELAPFEDAVEPVALCRNSRGSLESEEVQRFGDAFSDNFSSSGVARYVSNGTSTYACNRDSGKSLEAKPTAAEFERVGLPGEGIAALSGIEGMVAYRLDTEDGD